MNVIHTTTWTCDAERCGKTHEQRYVESVWAALDSRCATRRPVLPEGWNEIEGRVYCDGHTVEVKAIVRTPTVIVVLNPDHPHRVFVAGDLEEIVELRHAA